MKIKELEHAEAEEEQLRAVVQAKKDRIEVSNTSLRRERAHRSKEVLKMAQVMTSRQVIRVVTYY